MKYKEFNNRQYEAHRLVYDLISPNTRVLDLGCATGYFGRELQSKQCQVIGVESDKEAAKIAEDYCQKVIIGDLEWSDKLNLPLNKFDYVMLLDVLEHLKNRQQLLINISKWLKHNGKLVISTPNIAHISVRLKLLVGDFNYTKWGIMDDMHLHFFTRKTLIDLLRNNGYNVVRIIPTADFGQLPKIGKIARYVPKHLQYLITQSLPTLFAVQFVVVADIYRH